MLKAFYNTLTSCLVIVIVLVSSLIGLGYLMGIKPFVVLSGSMEPAIKTGSVCFVNTKESYDNIVEGDVIAYEINGVLVTHRAIDVSLKGIETKGDANEVSDGISTLPSNFMGKTIFSIPYMGIFIQAIQSPKGIILSLTFFITLILFDLYINLDNNDRKENDTLDTANDLNESE